MLAVIDPETLSPTSETRDAGDDTRGTVANGESVRHSTERILVYTGDLPRPNDLDETVARGDTAGFERRLPSAVDEVVNRQTACGVDVVNDGEYIKAAGNFSSYIQARVSGWEDLRHAPAQAGRRR